MPNMTVTFRGPGSIMGCISSSCDSGVPSSVPLPFTPADSYSPAPTLAGGCCNTPSMPSHPEPVGLMDNLVSPIATPEPSPNALARRLEGSQ